jgi:hypothetical protein
VLGLQDCFNKVGHLKKNRLFESETEVGQCATSLIMQGCFNKAGHLPVCEQIEREGSPPTLCRHNYKIL